ncbi:hypothetical protein ACFLXQ_09080 [Chloroflexota bacterium]
MTDTNQEGDSKIYERAWIALEQDSANPDAVLEHLSCVILELKKRLTKVFDSWRNIEIFELDDKSRSELNQARQYAIDMKQIIFRALHIMDEHLCALGQGEKYGEFRLQLSDMAHQASYEPIIGVTGFLLDSGTILNNTQVSEWFHELIDDVDRLASYMDSKFSSSSILVK